MPEVVVKDYYVFPEEAERSMKWFEDMYDVLRIDEDNRIWVRAGEYWYTSNTD